MSFSKKSTKADPLSWTFWKKTCETGLALERALKVIEGQGKDRHTPHGCGNNISQDQAKSKEKNPILGILGVMNSVFESVD